MLCSEAQQGARFEFQAFLLPPSAEGHRTPVANAHCMQKELTVLAIAMAKPNKRMHPLPFASFGEAWISPGGIKTPRTMRKPNINCVRASATLDGFDAGLRVELTDGCESSRKVSSIAEPQHASPRILKSRVFLLGLVPTAEPAATTRSCSQSASSGLA